MLIVCERCKNTESDFRVPYDHIGIAFMVSHFQEKHPEVKLNL